MVLATEQGQFANDVRLIPRWYESFDETQQATGTGQHAARTLRE